MTKELKPCPFCGGSGSYSNAGFGFIVKCRKCGSKTSIQESGKEAADAWNTRSIENEIAEKIWKLEVENKRLREALEFYAELDGNGIQLYGDMDSKALEFVDGDSQIFGTIAKDALKGNEK